MNILKYFHKTDFFIAISGALAGYFSQDVWFQKICVSNGEILKIGSCKIYELRFIAGALLGALGCVLIRLATESYCKDSIPLNQMRSFRNRFTLGLSILSLSALTPFLGRPQAFIPILLGISLLVSIMLSRRKLFQSFQKKGISVWSMLLINSLFTLFATDLMFSWIGHQRFSLTFPTQFIFHNWVLIHCVLSALYLLTFRPISSTVATFILFSVLNFSAGEKFKFLGLPLYPWDLQMTGDGATILKEIWDWHSSIAVMGCLITLAALSFITLKTVRNKTAPFNKRIAFFVVTFFCATLVVSSQTLSAEEIFPDFHGVRNSQLDKGAAYFLTLAYKVGKNKQIPEGYSKDAIAKIIQDNQSNSEATQDLEREPIQANVIFYMIESFIDPSEFGVRYKTDPMPYFHSLKKDHSYGHMAVSIYGGGTANTEYEIMTGMSISQLLPGILAYYQLSGKTPSLGWLFKDAGYVTHAFNGWSRHAFNWEKVYPSMGIDHFIAMNEDLPNSPELYGLYSDEGIVDLVLEAEKRFKEPAFIAVVTNATHIPYEKRIPYNPQFEVLNTELSSKSKDVFSKYAEVVHHSDIALKRLIESLSRSSKKTILIAYGDHLPGITYAYDELSYFKSQRKEKMHQVPLLIWNNFGAKKESLFLSSNFLGLKILDILGTKKRGHFGLLKTLANKFPVLSHAFENETKASDSKTLLKNYELIQFDLVGGNGYLKNLIDTGIR